MIWDTITIMDLVQNGRDELGNDVYEMVPSVRLKGRKNAPKDVQTALGEKAAGDVQASKNQRYITKKEHLFYLPKNQSIPARPEYMEHKGQLYKVVSVEALTPRFTEIKAVTYEGNNYRY